MIGVVDAIAACEGVHGKGFTFVSAKGPGEDLFLDFDALGLEIRRRAAHLRALGLRKGDRVALVIPDGPDFIPLFLGALWAGIVPVPLYPPTSLGKLDAFMEALVGILNVAEPRILATDARIAKVLWGAIGRVPSIEKVVEVKDLAAPAPEGSSDAREPTSDSDLAFLQFTSGSTAAPKGVMVTHGNLKANCNAILFDGIKLKVPSDDVAVSWLPLYHDMGLIGCVLCPLIGQIPAVYIPTLAFIKNATLWLETIHKHRATLTYAPNFAYALVTKRAKPEQLARWDLSRMRGFGCGAEPINPDVMRAFVQTFAQSGLRPEAMLPSYGMAEATLAMAFSGFGKPIHTDRIDAAAYHGERKAQPVSNGTSALEIVCCGRAFPGHEFSIQDEAGRKLPEREVGEICLRGPSVAAGYFRNPEATRAAGMGPDGGGWLRTGDLGYLADGEIYISGRIKDILIVNGRNYYPQAIEWLLDDVPGLRKGSTIAFSRPGKSSEEVVIVAETRERDLEALRTAIVAKVGDEMQLSVADVAFIAPGALPKTSSGKLQRRKTRELYLLGKLPKAGIRPSSTRLLAARHAAVALVGRARHIARGWFR
ncbi:MAG: fatty acyl-AMP ligase [Myxococcales bacterium]